MEKRQKIKLQIFASIIISILIIFGSALYLFTELSAYKNKNEEIIKIAQQNLKNARILHEHLYKLTQTQISIAQSGTLNNNERLIQYEKDTKDIINFFVDHENDEQYRIVAKDLIDHAKKLINTDAQIENLKNKNQQERINYWTLEQEKSLLKTNQFTSSIFSNREIEMKKNEIALNKAQNITIGLIAICLLIISYTFYKIYQTLSYLRKSSIELKKINKEFNIASLKIENTNWVLEGNAKLNEQISGVDESNKISQIVVDFFCDYLPIFAITNYIRKVDSYEFQLASYKGALKENLIDTFILEQGTLGKIAAEQSYQVYDIKDFKYLQPNTSLVKSVDAKVVIYPLIYENHCLGILELAIDADNNDLSKYLDFLTRASRNIATRIKFGQSHILVEQLLEETQIQTEELEAQQEELRITNEELIHKTNLLESSEEELRVQQEELTQTNIELNRKAEELEKRNQDLNLAQKTVEIKIKEVEQASKYKSEFMANMSHELRTPLNSILILAKLLQDNKNNNLSDEQIKYAKVIHGAGSDLLELINELLDLAKIESGAIDLHVEQIYTDEFIHATEDLFKALAKEKGINFITNVHKSVPKSFYTDEYRVQQVVKNFLSNAFKFTDAGGEVNFTLKVVSDNICFEVKDSGKGISKEKQNLIFEAFRQEDGSTSRKYGGTGLGLSISKEIASLLGGRITLSSEIGVGSTFTLILPLQQGDSNTNEPIAKKEPLSENFNKIIQGSTTPTMASEKLLNIEAKDRKILIVEDDINFADILKGFAEDYGFKVALAHDGAKGIELARELIPSAIILDVMLPISDGWEVLRVLKEDNNTKHIPIHMMSAATFSKKDFIENGAIGFMHKPVTEDTIQKTFENININLSKNVKKILLIEDQELQSDYIKNTFAEHNINVLQTFTLESAWKKLTSEENIDCIILDMNLPDGNGLDLIEKIKENNALSEIPIIINTAYELPKEQYEKILSDAKATILKSDKSSDRLIDEVNLFLNKLNDETLVTKQIGEVVQTSNLKGKKVLIADDDMRNVFALTTSLQSYDMEIEIANNGLEAVDIMRNPDNNIDIILMDIMMPEMDGYEAIKVIREDLKYKNIPILAVTAKAMKGDREKSIQIGASDYVSKPIDIDKLTSLMQVWLA